MAETLIKNETENEQENAAETELSLSEEELSKKKSGKKRRLKRGHDDEASGSDPVEKHQMTAVDIATLRRGARETKHYAVLRRCILIVMSILVAIIIIVYAVSYFYEKFGSFTVQISKYDMVRQGLALSETPDFDTSLSRLNADIVYDMTNISGEDIPDNVDRINGSHNGNGYIAYTFYLSNTGHDTLAYTSELTMENVSGGVDEAIRIAVYKNGEKTVYGKTKSNGKGIESDCDYEFASSTVAVYEKQDSFPPGAQNKYTVVIWLEGNDPDCTDDIIGGKMKLGMNFKIIENT